MKAVPPPPAPPGAVPPPPRSRGLAVAALACGSVALVLGGVLGFLGATLPLAAVAGVGGTLLAAAALRQRGEHRALALGGLAASLGGLAFAVLWLLLLLAFLGFVADVWGGLDELWRRLEPDRPREAIGAAPR